MTDDSGTDGQVGRHGMAVANGPDGDVLDWVSIDWQSVEDDVRRLRQRIFTASREGDLKKARNLQKLMLRSRANALMSVRRVTEVNVGRKTAGVDKQVIVTAPGKAFLAERVQQHHRQAQRPMPVKRVYVPKANRGRRRPLGIPVIFDRALQALVVNALEPEWEVRFEPKSYGFRPGRGCHDNRVYLQDPRRQVRAAALDTRRGPGSGIRPYRPFLPSVQSGWLPSQEAYPRLAQSRGDRKRSTRSKRGGHSPRGRGFPAALERCASWDGTSRRSPICTSR